MPSIKGTASVTDNRALNKRMASVKFPANFGEKLNVEAVNRAVMTQWIEQKITQLLGFEDEIVQSTAVNLFLPTRVEDGPKVDVNPKKAQIDLEGFLGEGPAAEFAAQVWTLLLDAQASGVGVPKQLVEEKKKELEAQKAQAQAAAAHAPYPPLPAAHGRPDPFYNRGGPPPPPRPGPARRSVSPERGRWDEFGRSTRPSEPYREDSSRRRGPYDNREGGRRGDRGHRYDRRPPSPSHHHRHQHHHHRDHDRRPPPPREDRYGRYHPDDDDQPASRRARPRSRSRSPPSRRSSRRRSRSASSSSSASSHTTRSSRSSHSSSGGRR